MVVVEGLVVVALVARLQRCRDTNYRKYQKKQIQKTCRYEYLKPQREVAISLDEEKRRCLETWQKFDHRLWQVMQQSLPEVEKLVLDADQFVQQTQRGDLVLGFSDQVPWWGLARMKKQIYPADRKGKPRQKRGRDQGLQNHFRVTLMMRHVVKKLWSTAPPVGELATCLLVVPGEHCRLSNICVKTYTWLQSEEFYVCGKRVKRTAGCKVRWW